MFEAAYFSKLVYRKKIFWAPVFRACFWAPVFGTCFRLLTQEEKTAISSRLPIKMLYFWINRHFKVDYGVEISLYFAMTLTMQLFNTFHNDFICLKKDNIKVSRSVRVNHFITN